MEHNSVKAPRAYRVTRVIKDIYCFVGGSLLGGAFGFYLWGLYGQLTLAFFQQQQLVPTRIYSDVSRISLLQSKKSIEARLRGLGYHPVQAENRLNFRLHPLNYPRALLPERHHLRSLPDFNETNAPEISLEFTARANFESGTSKTASDGITENNSSVLLLSGLHVGNVEVEDIYLEPELVSTLARGGDTHKNEIRTFLKFQEIPSPIWKAIIAIEDQHFLEHKGLDPRGMARAIWVNLKTFSFSQGGSTITQQLVKNLMVRRTKNIFRKINELFLSLLLEAKFDKEQILERYLNEVYLGQIGQLEIHGIAEGAKYFFGKKLADLNLAEAALIAGLIRGPSYYSPYRNKERAFERQRLVLKKMVETGQLAEAEAHVASRLPIRLIPVQTSADKAPYFVDFVKAELMQIYRERWPERSSEDELIQAGLRVFTTLDTTINRAGQKSVQDGLTQLEKNYARDLHQSPPRRLLEGALATVDHSTGFIRALIGGRNYSDSNFNRILNMKRQVGSSFKPLIYLTAFQQKRDSHGVPYGPGHLAEDAPWTLKFDRGKQSWAPRNFERTNRGWVSFRSAILYSINTVAARLGLEVGIPNVIKTAQALGVESPLPEVPSLSLGVAELSPVELLRVYATLANRGQQEELVVIRAIEQPTEQYTEQYNDTTVLFPAGQSVRVFDAAPIDLLHDILQDVFAQKNLRSVSRIDFAQAAAGKTGTTSNHRDAWFAGYTPQLTTVVWVGMDHDFDASINSPNHLDRETNIKINSAKKMRDKIKPPPIALTGAKSAFPIWLSFMKSALDGQPPRPFPPSSELVERVIDLHTGNLASAGCPSNQTVTEKFMQGFEPLTETCENSWPPSQTNELKGN